MKRTILILITISVMVLLSACDEQQNGEYPYMIYTSRTQANLRCKRVDAEKRIAYDCVTREALTKAVKEYHLASTDSWSEK